MATQLLSTYERKYIEEGINEDLREDGRNCRDYRSFAVQTGVVSNTSGSARVQLVCRRLVVETCMVECMSVVSAGEH